MESHKPLSHHDFAARKRAMTRLHRVTVVAAGELEHELTDKFVALGASGYTAIPCRGAGRSTMVHNNGGCNSQVRLEAVVPQDVANRILDYLRRDIVPDHHITVCKETVEVLRQGSF